VLDDPAVGRLVGPNLTSGGRGAELDARDWERAVRHGVRRDSTSLLIMPAHEFTGMADDDLSAIVAYARNLPAVRVVPPSTRAGPVVRALHLVGKIPGAPPDWKPAANITPIGIGHYTEADFVNALRTGKRPGGTPIDTLMPWRLTKEMSDVELRAIYAYLKTVPAREYGMR
jgi:hypothetical protein